ncbi:MAG TPA: ABC transporter substrate-binding protein, partial [Candidatus Baltobacteraceae bacterium]|nr:ABC transporter substrate-binding protein [Candidatus Baltobacteraceae bacterium]
MGRMTRREFMEYAGLVAGAAAWTSGAAWAGESGAKLGAQLIGKLEGPVILTDPRQYPTKFSEAPMLADLVKAGRLPAVEKRLPDAAELMVVKPVHEVGRYGGRWRRGFTGPADNENGNRICSTDKLLMFDYTGNTIVPALAKGWRLGDDGRITTVLLRKGLKWSDGEPFTADDFLFWYTDLYLNKELVPTPAPEFTIDGKPGVMKKVDDYTVAFEFPAPYFLFVDILAGDTLIGGGQATQMARSAFMGAYAPAHYV